LSRDPGRGFVGLRGGFVIGGFVTAFGGFIIRGPQVHFMQPQM
jgi:hypothetical protein